MECTKELIEFDITQNIPKVLNGHTYCEAWVDRVDTMMGCGRGRGGKPMLMGQFSTLIFSP